MATKKCWLCWLLCSIYGKWSNVASLQNHGSDCPRVLSLYTVLLSHLSSPLLSPVQPQRGDQTLQPICQQLYDSDANLREGNQEEDKICHVPPTKVQPEQDQPQSAGPPPQTDPEISSVHSLPAGKIVALTTSSFSSSFFLLLLLLTSISSFYVSCLCKGFLPLHHLMS